MPQNFIFHIRAPSLQTVCSCLGMDLTSMGQQEDLTATLMAPQLGGTMEVPMAPARGPTASMEASPTTPTALMEILMAPRLAGLMAIPTAPQLEGLMAIRTEPQPGGPMEIPMQPHQGLMEIPTAQARGPTASMEASPTVPTALTEIPTEPQQGGPMEINMERGPTNMVFISQHKFIVRNLFWTKP